MPGKFGQADTLDRLGRAWGQIAHLKCPSCVNPGSPMPSFAAFSEKQLRDLAIFLEASKGEQ